MAPPRKAPGQSQVPRGFVKTTILINTNTWMQAKRQALDEGTDLRSLLLEGLDLVLRRRQKGRKKGR